MDPCACCGTTKSCTCLAEDWCATCFRCIQHCPCVVVEKEALEPELTADVQADILEAVGRYSKRDERSRNGVTLPETRVTVRISPVMRDAVWKLQQSLGLSQSQVIRMAMEHLLKTGKVSSRYGHGVKLRRTRDGPGGKADH